MGFSVLMSVYMKENPDFLNQSLLSVVDQQVLKPAQVVLVKDGLLTPELDGVIRQWQRKLGDVLKVVPLINNVGLGAALNEGIKHCSHGLIARMDTDDVALPDRFAIQVRFMQENPEIAASSATLEEWDQELTQCAFTRHLPSTHGGIERLSLTRSPLNHPLAIYRKDIVLAVGGYPPLRKSQDYALWSLLLVRGYKLANLPDVLLKMRAGNEMLDRRGYSYFQHERELLRYQRSIGFLSFKGYCFNFLSKAVLRLSPPLLRSLAYKVAR